MKKILFILLSVCAMAVHAAAPIGGGWKNGYDEYGSDADALGLSSCKKSLNNVLATARFYAPTSTATIRVYDCYNQNNTYIRNQSVVTASYCQYSSTAPNTSLPLAQQCPDPPIICTAGKEYVFTRYEGTVKNGVYSQPATGFPKSAGGCEVTTLEAIKCDNFAPDAQGNRPVYCDYRVKENGIQSPAGTTPDVPGVRPDAPSSPEDVPKQNPAQGQGCPAGTVNLGTDSTGGSICGGSGSSPSSTPKTEVKQPATTQTNPDGSTVKTETTTRTNSDGSETTITKTTTTGADGKVTTTESSVTGNKPAGSGGGSGKDDSSDEKKDDFCLKNPNLNVCKNSEVMAGACSGGVDSTSCTGDAIQCAILREQKRQWCEMNKENPSATLANAVLAGNDPLKSTLPTKENATQINMQSFEQNGFLGGGACFQDKTVSFNGMSMTLPFSRVCPYLEWLRYVVMLIAALVSWRIVSKPVLGD